MVRTRFGVDDGHLHRRPFLHPPLRLPVADHQAQPRSPADRSGRAREQRLRRLRAVRRGRARRGALPVVLPRQCVQNPTWRDRLLARLRGRSIGLLASRRKAYGVIEPMSDAAASPSYRGAGRRGRRRARRLDRGGGDDRRLSGAEHLDPRRRAAHRRHDLLRRDLPGAAARARRQAAGARALRPAPAMSTWWSRPNCSRPGAPSRTAS